MLNLLRPVGAELGATADRENFEKVVRTGKAAIGVIGPVGPVSGKRLVALRAPVERDGALKYVLTIALVPDAVSRILRSAGVPQDWIGAIVDGRGNIVARTVEENVELGRPASPALREAIAREPQGAYVGSTLEGVEVETIYRTLPETSGWSVHLGIPTETLNAPVTRSAYFLTGGGAVSLALAVGLAWLTARDIAQRRKDQELRAALALDVSETRRAMAVEAAALGTFSWDLTRDEFLASQRSRDFLNLSRATKHGGEWRSSSADVLASVHAADRERVETAFRQCIATELPVDIEFRIAFSDGRVEWRRSMGRAQRLHTDHPSVIQGVISDIGASKQAEAERLDLLRQLSAVQENEQRRIARELHDQIGQSVTGLMLGLQSFEETLKGKGSGELRDRLRWLKSLAGDIGRDIHQVAAELRPTALDDLGLYRAISSFSSEWGARYGLHVDVQALGDLGRLPPDIETAVYRITQEALTNVLKHAKARTVSVVLERKSDRLSVIIEDDGQGLDPNAIAPGASGPNSSPRLGLSGIRERVALVGGTMTLELERGVGTTIFITLPLSLSGADTP